MRFGEVYPGPNGASAVAKTATTAPWRTLHLAKPISTHEGQTAVIALREPTLTDYIELGDVDTPVATEFENGRATVLKTHTDRNALIGWAAALSGLDQIILGQLTSRDAGALFEAVRQAVEPFSRPTPDGKGGN